VPLLPFTAYAGRPATRTHLQCDVGSTSHLARCVVFGSFVTAKPFPNDVDVFLLMEDTFDVSQLTGEARLLFEHAVAQTRFGTSVF
jgi:hypothetical protein